MAAVPKFGEWDNGKDTTLYTARFDVARSERGSGGVGQGVGRGGGGAGAKPAAGVGARRVIMNPNDPLENPDAFNFGNRGRGVKSSDMDYENQRHPPGYNNNNNNQYNDRINGPSRPPSTFPSPARHAASPAKAQNRVRPPSTPPRASVNPSGITANRGRPALPTFGEWDDPSAESEGYTDIFNNARGQPSMQIGKNPMKELEDDAGRKHQYKKSSFCGLFRQHRC